MYRTHSPLTASLGNWPAVSILCVCCDWSCGNPGGGLVWTLKEWVRQAGKLTRLSQSGPDWTKVSQGLGDAEEDRKCRHSDPGGLPGEALSEISRRNRISDLRRDVANSSLSSLLLGPGSPSSLFSHQSPGRSPNRDYP